MKKSMAWLAQNGCELRTDRILLTGLYLATGGNPCKECTCQDTCPAWKAIKRGPHPVPITETNADIAGRLGVSKRQISKMKKRGEL